MATTSACVPGLGKDPGTRSELWNEDLAPTDASQRTWRAHHYVALWIGMVMCIPAYLLASGLIEQGMSAAQAIMTVLLGNLVVLAPMLLIGHAGARHGVPFAVLVRSSFGVRGARLPALLRAIVASGWFGIQCWVGGAAIYAIGNIASGGALQGDRLPGLGISPAQLACFLLFWAMHLYFIARGPESIRWLETVTAPLKVAVILALLAWAWSKAGGFGSMLSSPSQFVEGGAKAGRFWAVFWPSLTAMVGFWATLAMNIPDFTRFARSQRDQVIGQSVGLPVPMGLMAFISVAVTSSTVIIYGEAIWDPVDLAGRLEGAAVAVGLLIITIDTLCVNLAANTVGPAYDFAGIFPRHVNFATGGYITAVIGIVIMPWKLIETTDGYIFTWLIGYGALLGPVMGIMLVDYWLVRRTEIDVPALYEPQGRYAYRKGWNPAAIAAFAIGVLPNLPGFLAQGLPETFGGFPAWLKEIYNYAWFVGVALAAAVYWALMRSQARPRP